MGGVVLSGFSSERVDFRVSGVELYPMPSLFIFPSFAFQLLLCELRCHIRCKYIY